MNLKIIKVFILCFSPGVIDITGVISLILFRLCKMASTTLAADAGDWHADGRGKSKFQWELEAELGSNWKILELPNVCQTCFPPWCEKFKAHHCTMSTFKEQSLYPNYAFHLVSVMQKKPGFPNFHPNLTIVQSI